MKAYNFRKEHKLEILEGTFLAKESGFGFVYINDNEEDIFVANRNKLSAMNNDIVEVKILKESSGARREGAIKKILSRANKKVVGTFQKGNNFGFVVPDDKKIDDIYISKAHRNKAKNNQKVVCEITKYPSKNKKAEGKIDEIIGFTDEIGVDMLSIIKEYNLQSEFPEEALKEARKVAKEKVVLGTRRDFRKKTTFTIDSESAKDLDDAVGVEKNADGSFTLYVHIADVSHYVKAGEALDNEAIVRGTSVYMLDRVIPMLPKELSNGACSLNQHEDKYALSVIMKIDEKGKVIDSEITKSVINVTKRMNYHDVYAIIEKENAIDNKNEFRTKEYVEKALRDNEKYIENFDMMKELATILKERRLKNGYLSLDIPESQITLDEYGKPCEIKPYETTFANEIIEEFMLTANEVVAETFYYLDAPFIYRVHEKPDEDKITELNKSLFNFGYKVKGKIDEIKPSAFSKILEESKGTPEEKVIANLLLRTLKIAKYDYENKGHFGIASDYYCHFTSPIRRYPDLFIHRVISRYLDDNYNVSSSFIKKYKKRAVKYSDTSSKCEQNATKAERESEKIKKAEYMEDKIGNEYDGIISGVTKFGIFVELDSTVEGLVRFEDMKDDHYIYNELNKSVFGKASQKIYKLGDCVHIKVKYASKAERKIDFIML